MHPLFLGKDLWIFEESYLNPPTGVIVMKTADSQFTLEVADRLQIHLLLRKSKNLLGKFLSHKM